MCKNATRQSKQFNPLATFLQVTRVSSGQRSDIDIVMLHIIQQIKITTPLLELLRNFIVIYKNIFFKHRLLKFDYTFHYFCDNDNEYVEVLP